MDMDGGKCARRRRQFGDEASEFIDRSKSLKLDTIKPAAKCVSKQVQQYAGHGPTQGGRQLSSFILFASVVILLNLCPPFNLDSDQALSHSKSAQHITTLNTGFSSLESTMSQLNNPSHSLTTRSQVNTQNKQHFECTTYLDKCLEFVKLMFTNPMRMSKRTTRFSLAEARVLGKMAKVWYIKKKIKKLSKKLKKHTIAVPVFTAIPIYEHSY